MRKLSITVAILMSVVTFNAHAWSAWEMNGAKMDIDGKDVRVASVKTFGDGHVFNSHDKELEKGIYVEATSSELSQDVLPFTTALIRDFLRLRGVNVADNPEGCALKVKFIVNELNIDAGTVANAQSGTNSPSAQGADLAAKVGTVAMITKASGALAGVAAYGTAGGYHYNGNELTLTSEIMAGPDFDNFVGKFKAIGEKDTITARTAVKQSDPKTTTADLLTLMTKVWADKYFVKD